MYGGTISETTGSTGTLRIAGGMTPATATALTSVTIASGVYLQIVPGAFLVFDGSTYNGQNLEGPGSVLFKDSATITGTIGAIAPVDIYIDTTDGLVTLTFNGVTMTSGSIQEIGGDLLNKAAIQFVGGTTNTLTGVKIVPVLDGSEVDLVLDTATVAATVIMDGVTMTKGSIQETGTILLLRSN